MVALTAFRGSPTPESMAELDRVLRLDGYDNKTIRGHIVSEMTKVQSDADFEILMNTPYGPNGKPFQEQYPQEAAELRVNREQEYSSVEYRLLRWTVVHRTVRLEEC